MTEVYNMTDSVEQKNDTSVKARLIRVTGMFWSFLSHHITIVLLFLGLVVVLELVLGSRMLVSSDLVSKTKKSAPITQPKPTPLQPSFALQPATLDATTNQPITLTVQLDTTNKPTDGATAVLTYDPKLVTYQSSKAGTLYAEYTQPLVDQKTGKITITGIAGLNNTYSGTGPFATVTFVPKTKGTAIINFAFTPGNSKESAIAAQGNQILSSVTGATITVK